MTNQEWQLAKIPVGIPKEDDFKCADIPEPKEDELKDGEVLLELKALSVDPYLRGLMTGVDTYMPCFKIGSAMEGLGAGVVVKSKCDKLPEGASVTGMVPFRRRVVVKGEGLNQVPVSDALPLSQFVGCLGMPGLTAYLSLRKIAAPKEGDYAFVSGGAGAVGSTVIQLLHAQGVKVIASAGSDDKVAMCKRLGADEAFNYKTVGTGPELEQTLKAFAPEGFNIYYDNVGGRILEAALNNMAPHSRIVACGSISQYNIEKPEDAYGVKNLINIISKFVRMQGFLVFNWLDEFPAATQALCELFAAGKLVGKQTVVDGFDKMPKALVGLFTGENTGKMVVAV